MLARLPCCSLLPLRPSCDCIKALTALSHSRKNKQENQQESTIRDHLNAVKYFNFMCLS